MPEITLKASLYRAIADREGCWRVTFEVPATDGLSVAKLTAMNQQVLNLTIAGE